MTKTLAVLNTPYGKSAKVLHIDLKYKDPQSASFFPIFSNQSIPSTIQLCTSAISLVDFSSSGFDNVVQDKGQQVILCKKSLGKPSVTSTGPINFEINDAEDVDFNEIIVLSSVENQKISVVIR